MLARVFHFVYTHFCRYETTFITKIPSDNEDFLKFQPKFDRGEMGDKQWTLHKEKNGIEEEVDSATGKSTFVFKRTINNENFGVFGFISYL